MMLICLHSTIYFVDEIRILRGEFEYTHATSLKKTGQHYIIRAFLINVHLLSVSSAGTTTKHNEWRKIRKLYMFKTGHYQGRLRLCCTSRTRPGTAAAAHEVRHEHDRHDGDAWGSPQRRPKARQGALTQIQVCMWVRWWWWWWC